jgi:hypothetical protein
MDPRAALDMLISNLESLRNGRDRATVVATLNETRADIDDLLEWLGKGGFLPSL